MDIFLSVLAGVLVLAFVVVILYEYRIRHPDVLVLYEKNGQLSVRSGLLYPRHFSLPVKRTTRPIQLAIQATAAGNLGVNIKLAGSVAPAPENLQALIRIGGWNSEVVARAADETSILLEGLVKEHAEHTDIHDLSATGILEYIFERAHLIKEKFGVELVSLVVQSLDAMETEIADALRQQEQARLLEQTERLNNQARLAAAKVKFQADEEIAEMEHTLELKKTEMKKALLEQEAVLAQQRVEEELKSSRLRLAFEREELEILKNNPELLVLTPQAARLAEASQSLKNARTVISLTPQDFAPGSELLTLFQSLLQKALEAKKNG
ncbi:MAG: hypothetical protein ACK2UW_11610 [Anaerolineales bacterium]|jgi:hypothetical protein